MSKTTLTIPAAGGERAREEREACLEIRAAAIDLLPPGRESGFEPLSMFAVSATEVEVEDGKEPLL